jgi:DNA-binding MarR family transcriptional regulator
VASRSEGSPGTGWKFVTNHLLVLLCISEDADVRMIDVAERLGLTERAVQRIVGDLIEAGYLTRERVGRRNHYRINRRMPLRHIETQHRQLGELLGLLTEQKRNRLS